GAHGGRIAARRGRAVVSMECQNVVTTRSEFGLVGRPTRPSPLATVQVGPTACTAALAIGRAVRRLCTPRRREALHGIPIRHGRRRFLVQGRLSGGASCVIVRTGGASAVSSDCGVTR